MAFQSHHFKCPKCGDTSAEFARNVPVPVSPTQKQPATDTALPHTSPSSPRVEPAVNNEETPAQAPASTSTEHTAQESAECSVINDTATATGQVHEHSSPSHVSPGRSSMPTSSGSDFAPYRQGANGEARAWGVLEWLAIAVVVLLLSFLVRKYLRTHE